MTQSEKKLLQDTHDSIIRLEQAVNGNGVEGLASKVNRHEKAYWKLKGILAFVTTLITLSAGTNIYLIFFR